MVVQLVHDGKLVLSAKRGDFHLTETAILDARALVARVRGRAVNDNSKDDGCKYTQQKDGAADRYTYIMYLSRPYMPRRRSCSKGIARGIARRASPGASNCSSTALSIDACANDANAQYSRQMSWGGRESFLRAIATLRRRLRISMSTYATYAKSDRICAQAGKCL